MLKTKVLMIWEMSKTWTPIKTQVHKPAFSKQVHTLGIGVKFCVFRYRAKIISHSFSAKKTITQEHKKGWLQSRTPGLNMQVILPDWSGGPRWSMVWGCYDPGKAEWAGGKGCDWSNGRGSPGWAVQILPQCWDLRPSPLGFPYFYFS